MLFTALDSYKGISFLRIFAIKKDLSCYQKIRIDHKNGLEVEVMIPRTSIIFSEHHSEHERPRLQGRGLQPDGRQGRSLSSKRSQRNRDHRSYVPSGKLADLCDRFKTFAAIIKVATTRGEG